MKSIFINTRVFIIYNLYTFLLNLNKLEYRLNKLYRIFLLFPLTIY
jgi:hypothetical protein